MVKQKLEAKEENRSSQASNKKRVKVQKRPSPSSGALQLRFADFSLKNPLPKDTPDEAFV